MDLKYYKNFRMKLDELLRTIVEERFNKSIPELSSDSLEKLNRMSNQWLECYMEINDQLNEKKQDLLTSRRVRLARKQTQGKDGESNQ